VRRLQKSGRNVQRLSVEQFGGEPTLIWTVKVLE
jgi:hypothetical protein